MQAQKYKSICNCLHEKKAVSKVNSAISLCFNCSSVIFNYDSNKKISTIKPSKFSVVQETAIPIFLSIPDTNKPYNFINKSDYQKIRNIFIKRIKLFCTNLNISKKTYFLTLDYFDRVCSKLSAFDMNDLLQISQLCIILAAKFCETQMKIVEIKKYLNLNNNYSQDELFILQLLDYDLYVHTSYDILMDIMHTGFLFADEKFSLKKMNFLYGKMENMLFFFSEKNFYIDMTHKEIALSIIGLIRETLGLIAYKNNLKNCFMNENTDIQRYYTCLKKLRKCFKIKDENEHTYSSTDSNSDNNSDNISENNNSKID